MRWFYYRQLNVRHNGQKQSLTLRLLPQLLNQCKIISGNSDSVN